MRSNLDLNAYNKTIGMFEDMPQIPNMTNDDAESLQSSAIVSIAISLKRIADKLELAQKQPVIMNKEEYENYLAAKERYDIGKAAIQKAADNLIKS